MGDLINGRTPEEIKAAVLCTERGTIPDCENCPYCGVVDEQGLRSFACYQAEFDLIAYVERLEAKQPKWISVKERLPEKRGIYLAHIVHHNCKNDSYWCVCVEYYNPEDGWTSLSDLYEVTHWMPLPEPPKEETHETTY